jgi:hypothetical protein
VHAAIGKASEYVVTLAKRHGEPYKVNHLTLRDSVDFKMLRNK